MTDNPNLNQPDDQDLEMALERLAHLVAIASVYAPPQFDDLRIVRNYIYTLPAAGRTALHVMPATFSGDGSIKFKQYSAPIAMPSAEAEDKDRAAWADIEAMLKQVDSAEPTEAEKQRREHVAALKSRLTLAIQAIKDKPLGSDTLPFLIDRLRDIATPGELDGFITERDETWLLWRIVVDQAEGMDRLKAELDQLRGRIDALDNNLAAEIKDRAMSPASIPWTMLDQALQRVAALENKHQAISAELMTIHNKADESRLQLKALLEQVSTAEPPPAEPEPDQDAPWLKGRE